MPSNLVGADYSSKKLNEIIFPGAHDAGTSAAALGGNVRTQSVDVAGQANLGCRYFDIRVAFRKVGQKAAAKTVATTFHAPSIKDKSNSVGLAHNKLGMGGGWGDTLETILRQARQFVLDNGSEFLILRFSKSANYPSIIQSCMTELGDVHFREDVNLGETLVSDLAGSVITVFANSTDDNVGMQPGGQAYTAVDHGVLRVKELFAKKGPPLQYDATVTGLQYFGKFSNTSSASTNASTQKERMTAQVHRDAVGMMYWTLTGPTAWGILGRNDSLWQSAPLRNTWDSGLKDAISLRLGTMKNFELMKAVQSQSYKSFMPNIVMIDDVNPARCDTIYGLNAVSSTQLANQFAAEFKKRGLSNISSARKI